MDKSEIEANVNARKCAAGGNLDDPNGCDKDCRFDMKLKRCVPSEKEAPPIAAAGKFMDGSKFLTFRSNKKPAFSFRIPINADTLIGKYSGAIRFAPTTGKLHLCYGPLKPHSTQVANRPVLSMLVKPRLSENLWTWYLSSGKNLQKKRMRELASTDAEQSYTDLYALPGASYQLSYAEANYLEAVIEKINAPESADDALFGLKPTDVKVTKMSDLVQAPTSCPPVLGVVEADEGCLESVEFGAQGMSDDDDDYDQLAVLGHKPTKAQEKLLSSDDESEKEKPKKKETTTRKVVPSPVPKRIADLKSAATTDVVLTASLQKAQQKAKETHQGGGSIAPGVLKEVSGFVKESDNTVFLAKGYEDTAPFAKLKQIVMAWRACQNAIYYPKGGDLAVGLRDSLVGGTTLEYDTLYPDSRSRRRAIPLADSEMQMGVLTVINYLLNSIPDDQIPVCEVTNKEITATTDPDKGYAIDLVQRLVLNAAYKLENAEYQSFNGPDAVLLVKYSFILSLCLAFLKAFRDIYKSSTSHSMAVTMERARYNSFMSVNLLSATRVPLFTTLQEGSAGALDVKGFQTFAQKTASLESKQIVDIMRRYSRCSGSYAGYPKSMYKSLYNLSDARCESALLPVDTTAHAYRSTTKSTSRRARQRAREVSSDSDSSSSDSD